MKTKLLIAGGVLSLTLVGGGIVAAEHGVPVPFLSGTVATVEPAQPEPLPQSAKAANTAAAQATAAQSDVTQSPDSDTPPTPTVKPKPQTVYSDQPSAATPCRLQTQNVYTNDCSGFTPQPTPAPTPVEANPAPSDPSATAVSNPNH